MIGVEWHDRTFVWRPPAPVRVASTSVVGGGIGERRWFLNTTVDKDYRGDPVADLGRLVKSLGLRGDGVAMMTAKDVAEVVITADDGVDVVATVGLGWPTWAAAPAEAAAEDPAVPGTINLLVAVPVRLEDAALVNAVATAAEAKVQALVEAGVAGTGTASDAVCIACSTAGKAEPYGGPRSTWGARIARAVHRAVLEGARDVITLVLGGMRSGKSQVAELLAAALPQPVTYLATGAATDEGMAARIATHRGRRPSAWRTIEAGAGLVDTLSEVEGTVLVDSLGTWVAACDMQPDIAGLCRALERRNGDSVAVSEEVGLGVHPPTELGLRFADAVGDVNRAVGAIADDVRLVVAGRTLRL